MKKGYSPKELMAAGPQRSFTGAALAQIVFPSGALEQAPLVLPAAEVSETGRSLTVPISAAGCTTPSR